MVPSEPQLGDVTELVIVGYHLRYQVAVVVDDGHSLSTLMVQLAGGIGLKHEIFVDKRCHRMYFVLLSVD